MERVYERYTRELERLSQEIRSAVVEEDIERMEKRVREFHTLVEVCFEAEGEVFRQEVFYKFLAERVRGIEGLLKHLEARVKEAFEAEREVMERKRKVWGTYGKN